MKKVLAFLAVAALALPAMAAVDTFKVTIDGSFCTNDSEGVGNAGDGNFRLSKANQHMGYMDWDGAVGSGSGQGLADFISANGGVAKAYLYVRACNTIWSEDWSQILGYEAGTLSNTAAIVTLRTGNAGSLVEDPGIGSTNFSNNGDPWPAGMDGTSQPSAFRMGHNIMPTGFPAQGDGIRTTGGEAWKAASTREAGFGGFSAGDNIQWMNGASGPFGWMYGDERYAVEMAIGGGNSWASNGTIDPTTGKYRFERAGQLVNKNADNSFRMIGPENAVGDGWYKVELDAALVLDLANNPENKGLVFNSYHNIVPFAWGNDEVFGGEFQGGIYAPYLEIVTPEPMTLTLLALGGLAMLRRRPA